ncbi:MAG: type II toxin-antitoxin system RelE/ParE family toxin [Betaproteobacteria bacterium]|nr:type II toxin-antitoxin system RelE/ParE family toxin [Betaproteobacteria bacterium]
MSRIEFAAAVREDFDRIFDHLSRFDPDGASTRIREIIQAIDVLESNPLIGRPAPGDKRELVIGRRSRGYLALIGRRSRGYLALYRYVTEIDIVFVLALRSQREAGYPTGYGSR